MLTLDQALEETRTGDLWLFRGGSRPDRAIQTLTNAPVNHVGMTVAIDDLPPLIWHAELGDKLVDKCLRHIWFGQSTPPCFDPLRYPSNPEPSRPCSVLHHFVVDSISTIP